MNPYLLSADQFYGYSGGMALYVATWQSMLYLYVPIELGDLLPKLNYLTSLN